MGMDGERSSFAKISAMGGRLEGHEELASEDSGAEDTCAG